MTDRELRALGISCLVATTKTTTSDEIIDTTTADATFDGATMDITAT